jgi:hypothetical protein
MAGLVENLPTSHRSEIEMRIESPAFGVRKEPE